MSSEIIINVERLGYLLHGAPFELEIVPDSRFSVVVWRGAKLKGGKLDFFFNSWNLQFVGGDGILRGIANYQRPCFTILTWRGLNPFMIKKAKFCLKVEMLNAFTPHIALSTGKAGKTYLKPITFRLGEMLVKSVADPTIKNTNDVNIRVKSCTHKITAPKIAMKNISIKYE